MRSYCPSDLPEHIAHRPKTGDGEYLAGASDKILAVGQLAQRAAADVGLTQH